MYVVHVKYLQEEKIGMKKTLAIVLVVLLPLILAVSCGKKE